MRCQIQQEISQCIWQSSLVVVPCCLPSARSFPVFLDLMVVVFNIVFQVDIYS